MKRGFLAAAVLIVALLAVSCNNSRAYIRGTIEGGAGETAYLVDASNGEIVDSVLLNGRDKFDFEIELPSGEAKLYNVKVGLVQYTVFPSAGEHLRLKTTVGEREYDISGSDESELVRQINYIMQGGLVRMDDIARQMTDIGDTVARRAYIAEYLATKRAQIKFIVENSRSLAAIYALYQRLPGDATLFNGESDIVYYRMVADSVATTHPTSPYLKSLQNVVTEVDNRYALINKIEQGVANPVSHPDIRLKDMYGRTQTLDNNLGKATLLVFTLMRTEWSPQSNAELKRIWERYNTLGLSIYHISLDSDRTLWLNAVQEQRLPWTSVIDTNGANSPSARLYNVTSLPTMFLLDKDGNVIGKNLSVEELVKRLNTML